MTDPSRSLNQALMRSTWYVVRRDAPPSPQISVPDENVAQRLTYHRIFHGAYRCRGGVLKL